MRDATCRWSLVASKPRERKPTSNQQRATSHRYAKVLLDLPAETAFSYRIPAALRGRLHPGQRVWVPLRQRRTVGCVVRLAARSPVPSPKPIEALIDETPLLPQELLILSRWVAERYCTSWGEALYAMLPGPLRRGRTTIIPRKPWQPQVVTASAPPVYTAEQAEAARQLADAVEAGRHQVFLLQGVTGSGKTEVYLHAISRALAHGRGSIVLVPEIALTPQAIERFTARFGGDRIAVLHSAMRESHRLQEWHRIAGGQARIVIGARSAILAPVHALGLIVVDEEHETTYKQDDAPRYHARETAVERARLTQSIVILGSATPSLESAYRAEQGLYTRLTLTERIDRRPLPTVQIVDLRRQPRLALPRAGRLLSHPLESALAQTLADGQQAIIFLNRRGFSTIVQCAGCHAVVQCPACQAAMTYHQAALQLICHHCRAQQAVPTICPSCEGRYVRFRGTGTQRVESELARLFPMARIARMDTDAMRRRGSHDAVLTRFRRGEVDFLVGTQMVAKGHDFPQVTLIGIINADTAMHLPDFRAAERTFGLLTQVAGRAGRGEAPGRVVIQTYLPTHYAIVAASRHDYEGFYRQELAHRRALRLPPVAALALVTVRALQEPKAKAAAEQVAATLRSAPRQRVAVIGPTPSPVYRLRRYYRWQIVVKANSWPALLARLRPIRGRRHLGGAQILIDIDPWSPW